MKYYYLIVILLLTSCKSDNNSTRSANFCDKLDMSKANLGDIPFILSYNSLRHKIGEPSLIRDSCASTGIAYAQGYNYYNCLEFDNVPGVVFKRYGDTVFIFSIDFESVNKQVNINEKILNKFFTLDQLVKECDTLKNRINRGASLDAILNNLDYVAIRETEDNRRKRWKNKIELLFKNNKLVTLLYDWQPMYSQQEWKNYLKVKNELELRK